MKGFFGNLFRSGAGPPGKDRPARAERQNGPPGVSGHAFRKGDVIGGLYEVHGVLGIGGFGLVYLVYKNDTGDVLALKTFRDEFLHDADAREAFRKEAQLWVALDEHPFILPARLVEKISGRLFVAMDYSAPDSQSRVNLADHLARNAGPLDEAHVLTWSIQFCLGMEHANKHGMKCHRDIKPANILISPEGTLRITDFGLASAADVACQKSDRCIAAPAAGGDGERLALNVTRAGGKVRCGTPGYMPPEAYRCEAPDTRGDIYSFGLVLYQMATGSQAPPFLVVGANLEECLRRTYERQMSDPAPRVDSPAALVIERCLKSRPMDRYGSFAEVRGVLESIWERRTGRKFAAPMSRSKTAGFWNNKGVALHHLGRRDQAIACFNKALEMDPLSSLALGNKAASLDALGRPEEALKCFEDALAVEPGNAAAWTGLGISLSKIGRHKDAVACFDRALALDPREVKTWSNKGKSLALLGCHEEAIICDEKALAMDPQYAGAWVGKGVAFCYLGREKEALECLDKALKIDPLNLAALGAKGEVLAGMGRQQEALRCFDKALTVNPRDAQAWSSKAASLRRLNRPEEAVTCYTNALASEPKRTDDWADKGIVLAALRKNGDAMLCFDRALSIDPRHAQAWFGRALLEEALGLRREAMTSYRKFIEVAPPQYSRLVAQAAQRLRGLDAAIDR